MTSSLDDQVKLVIRLLKQSAQQESPLPHDRYVKALEWVRIAPGKVDNTLRAELIESMCLAFKVTEQDIILALEGNEIKSPPVLATPQPDDEAKLQALLPKGGWFEWYAEYTRYNESPLSYHIMSSLVALGCALGRRCFIDMGHFKILAPVNAMLIGPTGVVHKSHAIGIAKKLIIASNVCPVGADKTTPERLMTKLKENPQQLICTDEMSVFFGKQKYMEGLTNLILKLLDYPDEVSADTVARCEERVELPTVSVMGGSTMSLLLDSTPGTVLSGGFLNRFMLAVESGTKRCFPIPRKGEGEEKLLKTLTWLHHLTGEVKLNQDGPAFKAYSEWYYSRNKRIQQDPTVAEVIQRGKQHVLRLAMLIHLTQCGHLLICEQCMLDAMKLLDFYERKAPELVRAIHSNQQTTNTDYILEMIRKLGGAVDHSTLLRRVSSRVNGAQLKQVIKDLNDSGQLKVTQKGAAHHYILREDEFSAHS